jgi:hypothetical protein
MEQSITANNDNDNAMEQSLLEKLTVAQLV